MTSRLQREDRRTARVALAAGLVFLLAASLGRCGPLPSPAAAQDRPRWHRTPEETLAALCVNEAGWDSPGDCAAIFAVLFNNGVNEGVPWLVFATWYSPRFFAGTGARPWTSHLRDSDAHPEGMTASWLQPRDGGLPSRRARFASLVAECRFIISRPPACEATDWGSEADYTTGRYARAHRHDVFPYCGDGLVMRYSTNQQEADPD